MIRLQLYTVIPLDTSLKKINDHAVRLQHVVLPGSNWVQIFPWMKKIPSRFATWKRLGEYWFARDSEMFHGLLGKVRNDLSTGVVNVTLGATLLKQQSRNCLSDQETAWLAGIMLPWFSIPEVQGRAHAELDAVVGRDRVPTFSDIPHLPYVRATVKEIMRWRPTFPLGIPHSTTEDDWYEGMFIPKGTTCFANVKACNQDPAVYGEDAAQFVPERHLDADVQLKQGPPDTKDEGHVGYGFGRRACVGSHLANNTVVITVATMPWATNISSAKDEYGVEIPVEAEEVVNVDVIQTGPPGMKVAQAKAVRKSTANGTGLICMLVNIYSVAALTHLGKQHAVLAEPDLPPLPREYTPRRAPRERTSVMTQSRRVRSVPTEADGHLDTFIRHVESSTLNFES
ncbi:cytochrome P450 [Artomyces pyxidatus]|uniref:Cytochrome P450 n=1 Tax=Artomyces pyxidatus TaxID=48021 RepID=A0ACB8SHT4_9AGAM|nr:cytochrome P450 [Artomyces pyxidatus]